MRNCHHYIGELNEEIMLVKNRQQSYWSLLSGGVLWAFYSLGIRARVVVHGCAHFRGERGGDWLFYELKHGGGTLSPSNIKQEFIFSTYYILVLYHIFACSSTDQVRGSWRHWSWMIVAASVLYFHSILYIKPRYVHWGYKKNHRKRKTTFAPNYILDYAIFFVFVWGSRWLWFNQQVCNRTLLRNGIKKNIKNKKNTDGYFMCSKESFMRWYME